MIVQIYTLQDDYL